MAFTQVFRLAYVHIWVVLVVYHPGGTDLSLTLL